ncbi:hypothetical protein PtA15_1A340 [Puccinia triticina]|uniref:Uncharacterized protein n=1 Tax=Puccinia triticina TaxID=208348 RepID=A0ABY7CAQ3_9BASI|nr:uncharacterized protein PtA15_1A340 [Puccinia triticina]WAQ81002.1 hypothetical protein PtA15_1A340 [Puccinia triticina]
MTAPNPQSTRKDPSGNKLSTGYATDQSETQNHRRSSRASSLVVAPNMVAVSSDSRLKLTRPGTQKQSAAAEDSADSGQSIEIEAQSEAEPVSDSEPVAAAKKTTKPKKKKKKVSTIPEKKTNTSSASKKKVNSKKTETTDHDFDQDTDEGSVVVRLQGGKARKDNIANIL